MIWRIEVKPKEGVCDVLGDGIQKDIVDLGLQCVDKAEAARVYNLEGTLRREDIEKICRELLVDPVTQEYRYWNLDIPAAFPAAPAAGCRVVEIAHNPGVMDPVEESTLKAIEDLGIPSVKAVRTARKYFLYPSSPKTTGKPVSDFGNVSADVRSIQEKVDRYPASAVFIKDATALDAGHGEIGPQELDVIVNKVLSNKLIQHAVSDPFDGKKLCPAARFQEFHLTRVELLKADDGGLMALSREGQLFLNLQEMKAIRKHFKGLRRDPTDCELETIAQTWSEHCSHKTFRGDIRYRYRENGRKKTRLIRNLLKSTIVKATKKIGKPWCVSVFHDNAGVIKFDQKTHVCFKVETHNHPSALEPFGGANTGVGGVIRDILGTGLGAKPVCGTDVFCFAPPTMSFDKLPPGTIHPKRIMKGVVGGVRDYGNKMGIPTVNGAILFDERFVGNPLVYCGTVGIMPKDKVKKKVFKGDLVVVAGGRTGRDGIHGATFSSGELTEDSEVVSSGAVQIGNPIQEKKVLDALLKARDQGLYTAITDCGAGGLSSAVGEMGKDLGARVDLEKAPLKYQGLKYDEIWISESQERMVMSVRPRDIKKLLEIFASENVEAVVIGEFTGNKRLELFYHGTKVCDLDMEFLHEGAPRIVKDASWEPIKMKAPAPAREVDLNQKLLHVLSHYNVCSKEWVIRQYDHEVQGASVVKPLSGVNCDGPSDASVLAPKLGSTRGIAVANGINVRYGMIDPFWMAASCIDEAIRQIIAVGGDPEKIAILDNFCWGNPDKPDRLGGLVRAAEGCYKTAVGYQVPFISGKDSLYNEYAQGGESIAIPGTLLISAIGIMDDVRKAVTMDLKKAGNLIYCVGRTKDEMGGSIYLDTDRGVLGDTVPKVNMPLGRKIFAGLFAAAKKELIRSMHDCSEGGIGAALSEMAFAGGLGVEAHLAQVPYQGQGKRDDTILFSESNSRFLVEVDHRNQKRFEHLMKGLPCGLIGGVQKSAEVVIHGVDQKVCVRLPLAELKEAWQRPLRW
jgi:phosphoribosylformylglycinamidine synthase